MKRLTLRADGCLALPDLAVRHLGALPGDEIEIVASPLGELRLRLVVAGKGAGLVPPAQMLDP